MQVVKGGEAMGDGIRGDERGERLAYGGGERGCDTLSLSKLSRRCSGLEKLIAVKGDCTTPRDSEGEEKGGVGGRAEVRRGSCGGSCGALAHSGIT